MRSSSGETGINAGTLQFWKYKLKKQSAESPRVARRRAPPPAVSSLIEVRPMSVAADNRFEIELNNGRRLRLPVTFDANAVKAWWWPRSDAVIPVGVCVFLCVEPVDMRLGFDRLAQLAHERGGSARFESRQLHQLLPASSRREHQRRRP